MDPRFRARVRTHLEKTPRLQALFSAFPAKAGNQSQGLRLPELKLLDARFRGQGDNCDMGPTSALYVP
jgi:hypothetical protein